MKNNRKVSVAGAGKWGQAIADLISQNSPVTLYSIDSQVKSLNNNISVTSEIKDIGQSHYMFVAVPAQQVRNFCTQLQTLSKKTIIILCSKGIEVSTGKLLSDVVKEFFPDNTISILAGPNFADEVMDKRITITTIASSKIDVSQDIANKFNTAYFKFIPNDDIILAQVFGAFKNVLAILCGVVRGLEMGENTVASILTIGIEEILYIAKSFGGDRRNIISPAGVGDIFLSCNSSTSRNNAFGISLARGEKVDPNVTVEGKYSIIALADNHSEILGHLPLFNFVYKLVMGEITSEVMIRNSLLKVF